MPVTNGSEYLTVNRKPQAGQSLTFPGDLVSYPFWMSFSFYQYRRPNVGYNPNSFNRGITSISQQFMPNGVQGPTTGGGILNSVGNTIRLPLPNQMVDNQEVQYTEEEAGLTAGMAINAFQQSGGGGVGAAKAVGVAALGGLLGADRLSSSKAAALATQMMGVAVNPFLTVLFKSPKFKRHQLSWRLSPTNVKESATLNTILTTFRYNQLPSMSGAAGGALLTYPNIVQISVSNSSSFLYRFKPAVIESLSINFTPGGQPSFFGRSGTPTEIEIRLSLLEIEYYLQDDYGIPNTGGRDVGEDLVNAIKGLRVGEAGSVGPVPTNNGLPLFTPGA